MRGEILEDLLGAPHRDAEGLRRRAALVGLDLERDHVVLVARGRDNGRRHRITELAGGHATRLGGIAGEYGGSTVVVLPAVEDPGGAARALAELLTAGIGHPVTVGAEHAASGAMSVVEAHRDAARCLDVLVALDRAGEGACRDDLGIHGILLGPAGRDELDRFVRRTIGPLVEHDETRGSDLVRTAFTYFAYDGNLSRTASALYVHVNTLHQRIDRISALLGPQWRHDDHALQATRPSPCDERRVRALTRSCMVGARSLSTSFLRFWIPLSKQVGRRPLLPWHRRSARWSLGSGMPCSILRRRR